MWCETFKRFERATGGSVLPTFAIASIPLIVAMGAVVDYTNAYDQQTVVQDAMDSAALAAGKKIGLLSMSELQQDVDDYYVTNLAGRLEQPPPLETSVNASTITLTTDLSVPTYFLGIIGLNSIDFHLKSQATLALGTLEVAMVLDNSGSMNTDDNIATLRQAATNLTNTLYDLGATSTEPDPVKVGLVPFAASVNVGPNNSGAAWIDGNGIAPYHADSMDGNTNTVSNFDLLAGMNGVSWGGCVEARPMPYDVTDDAASGGTPATMFVPMLAPDAPDNWTCSTGNCNYAGSSSSLRYNGAPTGNRNYNNYLPDFGGTCSGTNANWTCANGSCTGGADEATAYERLCKYGTTTNKVTPASVSVGGIPGGPNFMCTTTAVTPLTSNKSTVLNDISNMIALGATNIQEGLMWGWRLLSPSTPFSEGRSYSITNNQKILVVMTDGFNTYYPKSNSSLLKSWYGAWGFIAENHLGTTSINQDTIIQKMNERTALACEHVKAADVTVYTVAFNISDETTVNMLRECATDPSMAFVSTGQSELVQAFNAIGDDISLLRISR